MDALSRDQVRRIDQLAIEKYGMPGVVLMENAGRASAEIILSLIRDELTLHPAHARVAVLCGGGNNGGDGYVIARHLHNAGCAVTLFAASDPDKLSGDARINYTIVERMRLPLRIVTTPALLHTAETETELESAQVIVDALLGTGFHGAVRSELASVIEHCNALRERGKKVVAIDVPSGLDCDSGAPSNAVVRADVTVTFVAQKRGFLSPSATPFLGRVCVADIGAPRELIDEVRAT
jgi:NAD(P)H-hydrate epimerase